MKTLVVFISPNSTITPRKLAAELIKAGFKLRLKETCYGLIIEGGTREVEEAASRLRAVEPSSVFIKERGFPLGDPRVCRSSRGGGPRQGFHQLEGELEKLSVISWALAHPEVEVEQPRLEGKVSVEELKRVVDEALSQG